MKRVTPFVIAVVAVMSVLAGQANAGPIFALPSPAPFTNGSWSFGEIFTVGAQNITVTSIGAFDSGRNGFTTAGGILAGIYRESTQALLASTTVLSTDPLVGDFRYHSIAPLTLLAGTQYRVVAVSGIDQYNIDLNFTVNPLVTRNGYGYGASSTLIFDNSFTGTDRIWFANFQADLGGPTAVPEPTSLAVFGMLAAAGAFYGWRRRKVATA